MKLMAKLILSFIAVFLAGASLPSAAEDIETITHGDRVDITAHLAPGKLTLVDFYADWCGPCRSLAPKLDRLATANPDSLAIRKIDVVNWESDVAAQYRIQSIPHLKLFDENGRLLAEGNAGQVMAILDRRLGGSSSDGVRQLGAAQSNMPLFFAGALVILVIFLILRSKSPPKTDSRPTPTHSPDPHAPSGWFIMMQDSLEGPFAEEDLDEMVRRGEVSGTTKARRRGQSTWTSVGEIIEHLI